MHLNHTKTFHKGKDKNIEEYKIWSMFDTARVHWIVFTTKLNLSSTENTLHCALPLKRLKPIAPFQWEYMATLCKTYCALIQMVFRVWTEISPKVYNFFIHDMTTIVTLETRNPSFSASSAIWTVVGVSTGWQAADGAALVTAGVGLRQRGCCWPSSSSVRADSSVATHPLCCSAAALPLQWCQLAYTQLELSTLVKPISNLVQFGSEAASQTLI